MSDVEVSAAKERVLDSAEALFMRRGYNAITLRDIAETLGIRQASLYYHFPDGKEQIYVEVAERAFERHRAGMVAAIEGTTGGLADSLRAVARWFESQPQMNFSSIMHADMPALSEENAAYLGRVAYTSLFGPLRSAFIHSSERNETRTINPDVLAGTFLAVIDGMAFAGRRPDSPSRPEMIEDVLSVLLDGLRLPAAGEQAHSAMTDQLLSNGSNR